MVVGLVVVVVIQTYMQTHRHTDNPRKSKKYKKIQEIDYYSRILIRSAQNHTPPPLALGTFNENPYAKTVWGFWLLLRVLSRLGSSGRLVGFIPTDSGTYKSERSRVKWQLRSSKYRKKNTKHKNGHNSASFRATDPKPSL